MGANTQATEKKVCYIPRPLDEVIADWWEIYDRTLAMLKGNVLPEDGKKPVYAGSGAQLHLISNALTEIKRLEERREAKNGNKPTTINIKFRDASEPAEPEATA